MTEQPALRKLQYLTFDTFNKIKPRDPTDKVVIVDIDEESLAVLKQWPWPRDVVGKLVEKIAQAGAASIAFDMVFSEEDRTSPDKIASRLPDTPEMAIAKQELLTLPDNDDLFTQSIQKVGNVVTGFVASDGGHAERSPAEPRGLVIENKAKKILQADAKRLQHVVASIERIESAAAGNGHFYVAPDLDGIVRRVPLIVAHKREGKEQTSLYPSLSLEAVRVALGGKNSTQIWPRPVKDFWDFFKSPLFLKIGGVKVPIDNDGQFWVYYTPRLEARYIPAWKVLAGSVDPKQMAGKIVFVGTSAIGLKDIRSSPLDLFLPGVEMHVNVVEQILQGKFLSRPDLIKGIEPIFIFVIGLLVIVLSPFVSPFILFGTVMMIVLGAFSLSWKAFSGPGFLIDPVYPSVAVMVIFVLSALFSYLKSEYERSEIRDAFGHYISPDFMTELTKNPEKLKLGGEIKPLTIMFTDIRNFTTIAEGMTPEVLINTMNDFLTPMSDEVMRARGTIDKYMGDAMMAFWNAPLDVENHEKLAVRAALGMRDVLAPVNESIKAKAVAEGRQYHPLNCGIGINTGPVAVGNMGSRQRFAYSVLGDAVNLASRLEGQTKTYGLNILIGETTANNAREFGLMEIDLIKVKGKTEPVRIYTVLGDEAYAADPAFRKWQDTHNAFLEAYRARAFDKAQAFIKTCRAMDTQDMLGDYYMVFEMRIADFTRNMPPSDWDGVYTATGK
ncbi:MAG: adenylate/guanylate cyclase domain-containing protein [Alphaproteobacteria bacterium]|nr:adenylate/guanylate cyclase domain-containing protein [Alphaproteobacteria bacterium]